MSINTYENKANGYGIKYHVSDKQAADTAEIQSIFEEATNISETLFDQEAVLLEGNPGAGKTEILDSLFENYRSLNHDVFYLKVHINAGKSNGGDNLSSLFDDFNSLKNPNKKCIFLSDNCDFLGYKGHRSRISAERYSQHFLSFLKNVIGRPDSLTLGTSHTEEWRTAHWSWENNSSIQKNAKETLEIFRKKIDFFGKISINSMEQELVNRGCDPDNSKKIARMLSEKNNLDHWHAKLFDFNLDFSNALEEIEKGREERLKK